MTAPRNPQNGRDRRVIGRSGGDKVEPRVNEVWLWPGVAGGPLAFALDRLAGIVLVSGGCRHGEAHPVAGLSSSQALLAAITIITGLIAIAAGLISWWIFRQTSRPDDEVTSGDMRSVPFWALGGILLSAFCLVFIVITGGLALAFSTSCQ